MKITTVIVTSFRLELFKRALLSVLEEKTDVFVLINGEDQDAIKYCTNRRVPFRLVKNKLSPAEARNVAAQNIKADWVHFLDDDAYLEKGFYNKAKKIIERGGFEVLGGPNLTPPQSDLFQKISGLALSQPWGAGPCSRRYSSQRYEDFCGEEALILCNLFVKHELLERLKFPDYFLCGEENAFLAEAARQGHRFYFSSQIPVWHERRESFIKFISQIYKYGIGRGQNILKSFDFKIYHVVPLGFFTILLFFGWPIALLTVYFLLNLWFSRKQGMLFFIFPAIHLFYALGVLRGALFLGNIIQGKSFFLNPFKLLGKKNF